MARSSTLLGLSLFLYCSEIVIESIGVLSRAYMGPRRAWALLALVAGLLALTAFVHAVSTDVHGGIDGRNQQGPVAPVALSPAPPLLLHSTACQIAGSWCPAHDHDGAADLLGWGASNRSSLAASDSSRNSDVAGSRAGAPLRAHAQLHKPLWPLTSWDVAGIGAAALALLLAASGGIGGGGILVPVYLMILGESR